MRINLITNLTNQVGLQHEYEILKLLLTEMGHEVRGIQFNRPTNTLPADLNIFDEVVVPSLLLLAPHNWIFPHPEWWNSSWDRWLPLFEYVLAKTHNTASIFSNLVSPHQVFWAGFMSSDYYDSTIQRERAFLHVAGRSDTKNTDAVVSAWARNRMPVPLTVVAACSDRYKDLHHECGIHFYSRVDDSELRHLYNSHQFFLMPSAYEGWGHTLHEAMGCGALVLTTNVPPMAEFGTPPFLLIPSTGSTPHGIAKAHQVTSSDICQAIEVALALPPELVETQSQKARKRFLSDNEFFKKRFAEVLAYV